ncbi:hypothetical protein CR513_09431, partial [Mucuna pruriens]
MDNDGVTKVIDVGDVYLQTNTGMQLWLRGVKDDVDVRFNMISMHMHDDSGYDNHFGYGKWKLTKAKKDMLPGLKNAKMEKCSHCMANKQTRASFKKHLPSKKSELLELVHSDVCGPFKEALGLYFEVKGPSGIRHEKTPPKTSQLNSLVERMNRTLIERVKHMLSKAKLPKHFWGEAFYTIVHVINLSPVVALNTKVLNKIWFDKDVKYDHLRVFDCKAFVHVPKNEKSKLDMKTSQCIFIGYGHDKYGYRMYYPVEEKLVRRHDVQFMEDQTIEDVNKLGDGFNVSLDDDTKEEQEMSQDENLGDAPEPLPTQLRRSNRHKQSSTRYTSDEYVTLTDGEEPKCYQESMESEERQKSWQSKLSKHIDMRYHWIHDALDVKLLKLAKIHIDDNGIDMMTKRVPRGKFEACCEIARLAITST